MNCVIYFNSVSRMFLSVCLSVCCNNDNNNNVASASSFFFSIHNNRESENYTKFLLIFRSFLSVDRLTNRGGNNVRDLLLINNRRERCAYYKSR